MKALTGKNRRKLLGTIAFIIATALLVFTARAQGTNAPRHTSTKLREPNEVAPTNPPAASQLSEGVLALIKMTDAGVSTDVLKTYVESSATALEPTHKDIIALAEHKVPDEVTTLLLKRGAQARVAAAKAKRDGLAQVQADRRMASGGLDPDSYEYFQYYYLQPRALAYAYDRLYPYSYYRLHRPFRPRGGPYFGPLP